MSMKRLYSGFGVGEGSCVGGDNPMYASDIENGTEGVYLGVNPESPSKGLYLTFWEADTIAQLIGFPHIAVYEEQKKLIDVQAQQLADLEEVLNREVHSLQLQAVMKEIRKGNKEILNALEGTLSAVRARLGADGTDAGRIAKPAGSQRSTKAL
jgi:hypothetical protein